MMYRHQKRQPLTINKIAEGENEAKGQNREIKANRQSILPENGM